MGQSAITGVNLGVPAFQQDFVNANLVAGVLTVNHGLNSQYVSVTVYDNNNLIIIPDDVTATSTTATTIDLTSYGDIGASAWRAIIIDKGATQSQISVATDLNLSGQTTDDIAVYDGANWVAQAPAATGFVGFSAYPLPTQTNIATGSNVTVQFNTERFDIGSNFNTGTYTFTAPVTGYYHFDMFLLLFNPDQAAIQQNANLVTTGKTYYFGQFEPDRIFDADPGSFSMGGSILANMTAGNTAHVTIWQENGTVQQDIGQQNSYFSGYLIGT